MNKRNKSEKKEKDFEPLSKPRISLGNRWVPILILLAVAVIIYSNTLNSPFISDDLLKIVKNPDIKQLSNIRTKLIYPYATEDKDSNYNRNDPSRPLTYLTFMLNYRFGKLNPFGYHLLNVLLHAFNAVLIFFLTKIILLYIYKKDSDIFSFLVALFFA